MKSITTKLAFLFLLGFISVNAQDNQEIKYRRSSLSMILIESDQFPNKEAVMSSWNNYPFPDKYNKHDIALKSIKIEDIKLTDEELLAAGFLKDTLKMAPKIMLAEKAYQAAMSNELTKGSAVPLKYLNEEKTIAVKLPNEKQEYQVKVTKVIKEQKLANQLVSTWFDVKPSGFDENFKLICERGFYNASDMDVKNASGTVRGSSAFADAGLELIRNTFVTFTKLNFVENEPVARVVRDLAKAKIAQELAGKPQILMDKALQGVDAVYEKTKEGYSLWSKTWLYRLNWNDSIATLAVPLLSNKAEFDKSDLFSLEFVGAQFNNSLVTFKIGEKRTESQLIDLALVRNVDNAFAELQRENDVFKPKTPVASAEPILAKIGKKEGLKGGEKFEVLERTLNEKTGLTEYKKVGTATVDKKLVWDNRYNAGEEAEEKQLDKDGNPITATVFKGSKKIQPGMLLKFIK